MYTESVALMNTTGQLATFRHEIASVPLADKSSSVNFSRSLLKNSSPTTAPPKYILRGDLTADKNKMSIAFREVFKEFNADTNEYKFQSENNDLMKKDRISDAFHLGEKLLLSNDNMRPKSRSKTSINSHDIHKVSPCDNGLRHQYSSSATSKLDRRLTEDISPKTHTDILSPISSKDMKYDLNSSALDKVDMLNESVKKGKRSRKRSSLSVKSKKGKHGRIFTAAATLQDKQSSVPSQQNSTYTQLTKPSRISSEPPSKISHASVLSYTLLDSGNGRAPKPVANIPSSNKQLLHNMYPLRVASAKANSNTLPSTHYMHGNVTCNPILNNLHATDCLEAQGQSVMIYKLEINSRVKSASSLKSDAASQALNQRDDSEAATFNTEELSLNAISCNLQQSNKPNKAVLKHQQKNSVPTQGLSSDSVTKEAVLTSIYGAVYHTADKVSAQAEELKKVKKIFLSDRQSGTIRESGMEFPCAPPATPTPDLMRKHEYVPSMSDIRSQRAVKSRLQAMEKEAHKKQEKRKEAQVKLEKQQMKDREKQIKAKQRKEIYALNKIMTELENKRFMDFCQAKGLNKV